jgi:hypothetical protein
LLAINIALADAIAITGTIANLQIPIAHRNR